MIKSYIALLFILILSFPTYAQVSLGRGKFNRCSMLWFGSFPSDNDPLVQKINSGEFSGARACIELLKQGMLDNNGHLVNNTSDARHILNWWFRFFISPEYKDFNFNPLSKNPDETLAVSRNIYEYNMAALHFTKTLFSANIPFNYIVLNTNPLTAQRQSNNRLVKDPYFKTPLQFNNLVTPLAPELLIPAGGLITGIVNDNRSLMANDEDGNPHEIIRSIEGGILGTPAIFTQMFSNRAKKSNGGINVARTLSNHLARALLCRELPILRTEDVVQEIKPNSELGFKQESTCLACHVTQDGLARTFRNYYPDYNRGEGNLPVTVHVTPMGSPNWDMPLNGDPSFYMQQPAGSLTYRSSLTGDYHHYEFVGIQELGETLATQSDDFYACQVSKIWKGLTGYDLKFQDPGDAKAAQRSLDETKVMQFLTREAESLKVHQNLMITIQNIIAHETF